MLLDALLADVFCVVQVDEAAPADKPRYKLAWIYKFGVAQYGPFLPAEPSYERSDELRRWLFYKCTCPRTSYFQYRFRGIITSYVLSPH